MVPCEFASAQRPPSKIVVERKAIRRIGEQIPGSRADRLSNDTNAAVAHADDRHLTDRLRHVRVAFGLRRIELELGITVIAEHRRPGRDRGVGPRGRRAVADLVARREYHGVRGAVRERGGDAVVAVFEGQPIAGVIRGRHGAFKSRFRGGFVLRIGE